MITCNLREKRFSVDFISGRALREIEPELKMYARIAKATGEAISGEDSQDDTPIADALDVLVLWFCSSAISSLRMRFMTDTLPIG